MEKMALEKANNLDRVESGGDFGAALDIVEAITDTRIKENVYLKIAREQVQAGLEPIRLPTYFLGVAEQREVWERRDVYEGIALLQADMGDVPGALETAGLTAGFAWFLRGLAKAIARQGVDPQPMFDRIYGKLHVGDASDVSQAGYTAQVQRELGIVPSKAVLEQFRQFDTKDSGYLSRYNLGLAEAYAIAGFPEDALEVWRTTQEDDLFPFERVETLSKIAISQAKNGIDPSELIAVTAEQTEAIKPKKHHHPNWQQAEIYANLARASGVFGLDPQPMVDRALKKALKEPSNLRADAYIGIAKAQVSFGADAIPTLVLALEWTDGIVKPGEEHGSGYGIPIQTINWADIFHVQLKGRYYDDARVILDRMDRYQDEGIVAHKAELLAELGKVLATS